MTEAKPNRLGVSYFGNRYPHHARQDLQTMASMRSTFVVHVMSEADLRWNPGTMAELVKIGNEYALQPWLTPWAVGGVFGGESASYAVGEHPEAGNSVAQIELDCSFSRFICFQAGVPE